MNSRLWWGCVAIALLLAGCSAGNDAGGGDGVALPSSDVPGLADVAASPDNDASAADGDGLDIGTGEVDAGDADPSDTGTAPDGDVEPAMELFVRALGTLGGAEAAAFGVNNEGQVVGWSLVHEGSRRHAFVWTDGGMVDLGVLDGDEESTARAINDNGGIVGTSESNVVAGSGDYRPFVYRDGTMRELESLGGPGGWAAAINASDMIIGYAWDESGRERAVIWTDGGVAFIGSGSARDRQRPLGINADGGVVGLEYQPMMGPGAAFRLDDEGWTLIGGEDHPHQCAEAHDINDAGVAVGFSAFPSGPWHAARWDAGGTRPEDLGTLPGLPYAELYAVNNHGWAVGRAYNDDSTVSRAILWNGSELLDLDALLPETFDGSLWEARDINDAGQVAATAAVGGQWHAVRIELGGFLQASLEPPPRDR